VRKIIITVAPVAGNLVKDTVNPVSAEAVARDVIAAALAGASQVHLHVRDREGKQTQQLDEFSRTLDLIRAESDIIIQGSTGGVSDLSLADRCVAIQNPLVEVGSLNMGSCNFGEGVYINTLPDIRYWSGRLREAGVLPEMEIFDAGMINNAVILVEESVITSPLIFGFVLGVRGALPATPYSLQILQGIMPPGAIWGCIHAEMSDLSLLATAIGMGASFIRVGFEDSIHCNPFEIAQTNAELVGKAAELIRSMGCAVASPAEARSILGLKS